MKALITAALVALATPALADEPKRVDAADIFVSPDRWTGVALTVSGAHIYYADANDVRILLGSTERVPVMLQTVSAQVTTDIQIAARCDTIKAMATAPKCRGTVTFTKRRCEREVTGQTDRVVCLATDVKFNAK